MTQSSRKFVVGAIAPGPSGGEGFAISDGRSPPVAAFVFATRADAEAARAHVEAALAKAIDVHGREEAARLATQTIPFGKLNASNDE